MKIAVRRGHQYTGQDGATQGIVKEIEVAERYHKLAIDGFKSLGHEVLDVTPPEANRSLSDSLNYGINMANNWGADLFISCHVNNAYDSYRGSLGCEVIYAPGSSSGQKYATNVESQLSTLGFKSRGAKSDVRGLAELKNTNMPAIIVEPFFVEATGDIDVYNSVGDEGIANAIVKGITGQELTSISNSLTSKIDEANQNCYVITQYLPTGYLGRKDTEFQGIDMKYVDSFMCGVRWELRSNSYGYWAVTELLDPQTAKQVKASLGSWFCEFRTNNK